MTLIRFRLFLINFVSFALVIGFGALAVLSFQQYDKLVRDLQESYDLEQVTQELPTKNFDAQTFASLQQRRSRLEPSHRMNAFSDVLQAYSEKNPHLYRLRVTMFLKNEKEFRRYVTPLINYLKTRVQYDATICLLAMVAGILFSWLYLNQAIFAPIKSLSRRMIEFLHQKYTYQFTQPAPNEIGYLQSTFNSLAQRVLQNMEDLTSLDNAKSEFLSIASHELRTPLTSIKGSLSLMRSGVVGILNEAAMNLVHIADKETDRLIRLINDILDLTKIEAGRLPLHTEWQSLQSLMQTNLESLQGFAGQADVKLVSHQEFALEAMIDKDRIQQVLTNLISNAIKYSPQKSTVEVCCLVNCEKQLQIEVRDQGRGIAPHDQELIFQKFRQATSPENPLVKGTGLGLAIAKAIVEEHGGTIGVRSTVGQGSTFYFTLPQWRLILEKDTSVEARTA